MRTALAFLAYTVFATAQSHPSWWTYSSPEATALIGIEWQSVRSTPFAEPIEAELWGDLGFPELACLHSAREFVISSSGSPRELLALASGTFSAAAMRDQGAKKGMKAMTYRGIDMWFASENGILSVARLNDQLILIGDPQTLQATIDRSMDDSRNYSPLLARAARFNQKDLWVVASQLPDDLANKFVPLDTEARGFEGSLSMRNGLEMEAVLWAGSEQQAETSADKLRQTIATLPAIARGLQVTVEEDSIVLALAATREQVMAALRGPAPDVPPAETIRMVTPSHVEQVAVEKPPVIEKAATKTVAAIVEKPVEKPVDKAVEKAAEKLQVIRILGLDDGLREIILPAAKPEKQNL